MQILTGGFLLYFNEIELRKKKPLFHSNWSHSNHVSFFDIFSQALSNVHSVRATTTDKDPSTWNFNPKVISPIFTSYDLSYCKRTPWFPTNGRGWMGRRGGGGGGRS